MDIPKILEKKLGKPVAVFGGGVSGKAVAEFLRGNGFSAKIYDRNAGDGAGTRFDMAEAAEHDLVVCSPGFSQNHPWKEVARRAGLLCLCEPDFAALFWQGTLPAVKRLAGETQEAFLARADNRLGLTAVTGTNGKTTLTEFLAFALRRIGKDSLAVGNNGVPMSRMLSHATATSFRPVCEISSFQAEELRYFSPRCVLWTNFDEDHIDRHGSVENYFRAKFRLVECQQRLRLVVGDFPQEDDPDVRAVLARRLLIVGESVAAAAARFGIALPEWTQIATRAEAEETVPAGSIFATFPQLENYAIARRFWLANGFREKDLISAALAFPAREHRLAKVREIRGNVPAGADSSSPADADAAPRVEFWDDSKGTNFHAVLAALETFRGKKIFWIGGGLGKGGDIAGFAKRVGEKIERAFLIGKTAPELCAAFASDGVPAERCALLQSAVAAAARAAQAAGTDAVVLFSPGFASFDMFSGYAERGLRFVQCVEQIEG